MYLNLLFFRNVTYEEITMKLIIWTLPSQHIQRILPLRQIKIILTFLPFFFLKNFNQCIGDQFRDRLKRANVSPAFIKKETIITKPSIYPLVKTNWPVSDPRFQKFMTVSFMVK